jgi:hypothetical protein
MLTPFAAKPSARSLPPPRAGMETIVLAGLGSTCASPLVWLQDTSVAGTMAHLFRGTYTNYVKCINVEDTSLRDEVFYDLQMPVSLAER